MLLKCYTQYATKFAKFSSGHRTGNGQFSFQSQRKAMPKNAQTTDNCTHLTHFKVMLKILQARLQQYVNPELPDVQAGFWKGREKPEIKLPTSAGSLKKQKSSRKNIYFCFTDYAKAFDCVDHNKLWKISEGDGNPRPPDLPLEKCVCKSRSNS